MDVDPTGRQFPIYRTFVLNARGTIPPYQGTRWDRDESTVPDNVVQLARYAKSSGNLHDDDSHDGGQDSDRHADASGTLGGRRSATYRDRRSTTIRERHGRSTR